MDEVRIKESNSEKHRLSGGAVIALLAVLLVLAIIVSFALGRYPVGLKELCGILISKVANITKFWSDEQAIAVWNVRMPRIILAVLVGVCLSAAGAAYQGVFQNPIAAPDILGASAGAGFGAALAIFLGLGKTGITALAFVVSLITVLLVFVVGKRVKGDRVLGLVLAGIMISSLFSAGTSFIKLVADPNNKLPAITYWLMGSLVGANWDEIKFAIWPMLIGLVPLMLLRWQLNVLTMGDSDARSMGVDSAKVRFVVVLCSTLTTAAAVSVSGMIGWVGLVIPHMTRRLVGSDYRKLLPASMLAGGTFMVLIDDFSRNLASSEIPIGILTAVFGAPLFLIMITRRSSWYD